MIACSGYPSLLPGSWFALLVQTIILRRASALTAAAFINLPFLWVLAATDTVDTYASPTSFASPLAFRSFDLLLFVESGGKVVTFGEGDAFDAIRELDALVFATGLAILSMVLLGRDSGSEAQKSSRE